MGLGTGERVGQRLGSPSWQRGVQTEPEGLARCAATVGLSSSAGWVMSACTSASPSHTFPSLLNPAPRRGGSPGGGAVATLERKGELVRCRRPPKPLCA